MKLRSASIVSAAAFAFVLGVASPASACSHNLKADITSYPDVTGKATLQLRHGDVWSSKVSEKGLPAGDYTYAILVNDVPAPGGGGHFTNVAVCTLHVVSPAKKATCESNNVVLPSGVPIKGSVANIDSTVTAVAQGTFQ